ncbi:MAG: hypothetical protein A2070_00305 [Bdellovibrionales bacterium GWC1_52_8]|nr:MAG: hypothetical protein A2Z97_16490 [Bdellovibrionales bacterium GWB1_52_6]OFZ02797.1 MAG: hypothetical protein A2X97_04285 [Bdellovibrionales bacterium GWA1_52_35]OFZ39787.1 MAG: hypothetical protein A2070_00305 [Bdellovibrionales bacterium GWC1_52_8]
MQESNAVQPGKRSKAEKVIRLFYGFQFFFALLLWVPIFYEFEHRIGLSDPEIFKIQSFYYLAFCLLEIPTGLLADFLGRRTCMRAGTLIVTAANLIPVFFQSFTGFMVHFFLIALARSLVSGAASAYLYDTLKECDAVELYRKAEGNARALALGGKVLLWAGVGALMEWQLTLPYTLTALATAISAVYAWRMPREAVKQEALDNPYEKFRQLGRIFPLLLRSPRVSLVIVQGVAIFVLSRVAQVDLFQPYLKTLGFTAASFGIIMGAFTLFEALGASHPDWVRKLLGRLSLGSDLSSVYVLTLFLSACLAFMAVSGPWGGIFWLCLLSLATGFAYPIQRQLMNDVIPDSRYRATFLSFESIIDRAGSAVSAGLIGSFVARGEVGRFLLLSAGISFAGVLVLLGVSWLGFLYFGSEKSRR